MRRVSFIIVNYNGCQHTLHCIESILRTHKEEHFEIIVIDNDSTDGSVETIQTQYPKVKILAQQHNLGFGTANNIGAKESTGEYLFFVNNDTLFEEDLVTPLSQYLKEHSFCGAVGPLLLNADGTYQHSYGYFPSIINEWRMQQDSKEKKSIPTNLTPQEVDWVSFAAVMIPRSVFEHISGFDERFFMYFEDADVCYRLNKGGWSTVYYPHSALVHRGGASWSPAITSKIRFEYRRSQLLFYSKHRSRMHTYALRLYLILKYLITAVLRRGEERTRALSVVSLMFFYYPKRS